jgi:hypothetical protein
MYKVLQAKLVTEWKKVSPNVSDADIASKLKEKDTERYISGIIAKRGIPEKSRDDAELYINKDYRGDVVFDYDVNTGRVNKLGIVNPFEDRALIEPGTDKSIIERNNDVGENTESIGNNYPKRKAPVKDAIQVVTEEKKAGEQLELFPKSDNVAPEEIEDLANKKLKDKDAEKICPPGTKNNTSINDFIT